MYEPIWTTLFTSAPSIQHQTINNNTTNILPVEISFCFTKNVIKFFICNLIFLIFFLMAVGARLYFCIRVFENYEHRDWDWDWLKKWANCWNTWTRRKYRHTRNIPSQSKLTTKPFHPSRYLYRRACQRFRFSQIDVAVLILFLGLWIYGGSKYSIIWIWTETQIVSLILCSRRPILIYIRG